MKLSAALAILTDLRFAIQVAILPTLRAILHSPSLLLRPYALSRTFMANIWVVFGPGADEGSRPTKQRLITPNAYGVVLDLGAGHGHTVNYLNRARISKYVALEPNNLMHPHIRAVANEAGYHESDGTLIILSCGAEDTSTILSSITSHSRPSSAPVDTIISVLTLCTIPNPQDTLKTLVQDVLKPGGQLLYLEHVLSPRADVAWWQRFWAPLWAILFDGCKMDRPTHLWVAGLKRTREGEEESVWREGSVWGKEGGESEENLFWTRVGRYVKR